MRGHLLGDLQPATIFEISRDACGAKGMAAYFGVTTPNVKNRTLRKLDHSFEAAKGRRGLKGTPPEPSCTLPGIVSGQVYIAPSRWGRGGLGLRRRWRFTFAQSGDGAFQIHGVPENDGGDNQVQAAGAISLVLETAVAEVALAVEEDGTRESVSGFAFVEAYLDTPAELGVFHPLQHEKRAFYSPDFAERRVGGCSGGGSWRACG